MSVFADVESVWAERLGGLRNVVRQHTIRSQLARHATGGGSVLDVGCGQGTQALALAERGYAITGLDPSEDLLARLRDEASLMGLPVETICRTAADLTSLFKGRTFDVVCAHGLLMYLSDPESTITDLASTVAPDGLLSITFRNGEALAYRPGIRGQWRQALAAFDSRTYVNELGATATAHTLGDVTDWCNHAGLDVQVWYGVRVLTDGVDPAQPADPAELQDLLAAEMLAGERDPYRRLGSQIHVIARRR